MKDKFAYVGKSVKRTDAVAKVTGKAKYSPDFIRPDMLVAKALFAKYPHAYIKSIDTSKAKALPGVETVMIAKDLPGRNSYGPMVMDKPVIAEKKVNYEGDPVAILAAVDEETALKALELIDVEYEELIAYDDPREAIKDDAFVIHPDTIYKEKGNLLATVGVDCGDIDAGFAKAEIIIENEYETPMVDHAYMEQDICIAEPDPQTGGIVITSANQAVFQGRRALAGVFNLPQSKVRCIAPHVGGGFGGKEDSTLDVSAVAGVLAIKTGKPVQFMLTREEVFRTTGKRHATYITHKLGAMKDGTIVAMDVVTYLNKGAYVSMGGAKSPQYGVTMRTAVYSGGTYRVPNMRARSYSVYTNCTYGNAFRGFGVPQINFAVESQIEELAKTIGMDSFEIRRKNMLVHGDKTITGAYMTEERGLGLGECLDVVHKEMGWDKPFDRGTGPIRRGRGIAAFKYGSGIPLFFEGGNAMLTLNTDGSLQIHFSCTEMGQGTTTVISQLAAEVLGMNIDDIEVFIGDTSTSPDSGPTVGSRTTVMVGNAVCDGAQQLRERILKVAGAMLTADPRDLDVEDSKIFYKGSHKDDDKALDFADVIRKAYLTQVPLSVIGTWYPPQPGLAQPGGQGVTWHSYAFGVQGFEVEVDTETGELTLVKSTFACDVGKALNPQQVEGQMEGATGQSIGWGIMEEHFIDKGRMENATMHKYLIPTSLDMPEHKSLIVEAANCLGPFGAKGVGEPGLIPGAPAIRNAIWDATGVKVNAIPLTPMRLAGAFKGKKF